MSLDIRIINLDRATERRRAVEAQLRERGLDGHFVAAVDGERHDLAEFRPFRTASSFLFRPLERGEVGCFASHYRLWQECVATRRPMLILEDDCVLSEGIGDVVEALPGLLDKYPYIRLAGHRLRRGKVLLGLSGGQSIRRLGKGPLGTGAYAIAAPAAARLLRHAAVWSRPVDNYVDSFWIHGVLPLAIVPYPVGDARTASMIGKTRYVQNHRLHKLCRQLCRHTHTLRRLTFKLGPAWQHR